MKKGIVFVVRIQKNYEEISNELWINCEWFLRDVHNFYEKCMNDFTLSLLVLLYVCFFHLKGISIISPGFSIEYSALKASMSTAVCWAMFDGSPRGCPNGHLR